MDDDELLGGLEQDLAMAAGEPRFHPDTMIGEFLIVRCLGRGGFGEVYEAENTEYNRRVALKFMFDTAGSSGPTPPDATTPDPARLLRDEIRAAAMLNLPNFVTVYALRSGRAFTGERDEQPVAFIEMELAAGRSLRDWAGDPRLSLLQVVEWMVPVGESIDLAHRLGDLIHYDLKPHNILLVDPQPGARFEELNLRTLVPKVSDFGLARPSGGAIPHGTDGFAPPEQRSHELDVVRKPRRRAAAIDGFALAATIYAMVNLDKDGNARGPGPSGVGPYTPPDPAPLVAAGAGPDLVAVLLKELAPDPGERYPTVGAFVEDLRRWLNGEAVAALNFRGATWKGFQKQSRAIRYGIPTLFLALLLTGIALATVSVKSANHAAAANKARADAAAKARDEALAQAERDAAWTRALHDRLSSVAQNAARQGDWLHAKDAYDQAIADGLEDSLQLRVERLAVYFGLNDIHTLNEELTHLEQSSDLGELTAAVRLARGTLLMCDVKLDDRFVSLPPVGWTVIRLSA